MTDASGISGDVATCACEFGRAITDPTKNELMMIVSSNAVANERAVDCFPPMPRPTWRIFMIYPFLEAAAETCASFNFRAQSSQQTSTVLPPMLTLKEFPSSLQSQAAQVVSTMTLLSSIRSPGTRAVGHGRRECRCQNL